jgi:hypothetical protein
MAAAPRPTLPSRSSTPPTSGPPKSAEIAENEPAPASTLRGVVAESVGQVGPQPIFQPVHEREEDSREQGRGDSDSGADEDQAQIGRAGQRCFRPRGGHASTLIGRAQESIPADRRCRFAAEPERTGG